MIFPPQKRALNAAGKVASFLFTAPSITLVLMSGCAEVTLDVSAIHLRSRIGDNV